MFHVTTPYGDYPSRSYPARLSYEIYSLWMVDYVSFVFLTDVRLLGSGTFVVRHIHE